MTNFARWCGPVLILTLALSVGLTLDVAADEGKETEPVDWAAKAKEAWHRTCQKCHSAPDSRFETDRGFLSQIMETS